MSKMVVGNAHHADLFLLLDTQKNLGLGLIPGPKT